MSAARSRSRCRRLWGRRRCRQRLAAPVAGTEFDRVGESDADGLTLGIAVAIDIALGIAIAIGIAVAIHIALGIAVAIHIALGIAVPIGIAVGIAVPIALTVALADDYARGDDRDTGEWDDALIHGR